LGHQSTEVERKHLGQEEILNIEKYSNKMNTPPRRLGRRFGESQDDLADGRTQRESRGAEARAREQVSLAEVAREQSSPAASGRGYRRVLHGS
jgi:hypothetical protein